MILDIYGKDYKRKGFINTFSSASYNFPFNGVGDFTIKVPITEPSISYLVKDNFVLLDEGIIGIIRSREFDQTEEEQNTLIISGSLASELFLRRCFEKTYRYSGKLSNVVRSMVTNLVINPTDTKRKISSVSLSQDQQYIPDGSSFKIQKTGDYLADGIVDTLNLENKGFNLYPVLDTDEDGAFIDTLEFRVLEGVDRTVNNTDDNTPVVFSSENNNIKSFVYEENADDLKNVAYGAGQGRAEQRYLVTVGETTAEDVDRYELYVDARDLQQEEGESEADYLLELQNRTLSKLSEHKTFVSIDGTIADGVANYKIGTDFNVGDFVSFKLGILDIIVDTQIVNLSKMYSNNQEFIDLTFGFEKSSIKEIIRKGGI